jgi:hypothetical protein
MERLDRELDIPEPIAVRLAESEPELPPTDEDTETALDRGRHDRDTEEDSAVAEAAPDETGTPTRVV